MAKVTHVELKRDDPIFREGWTAFSLRPRPHTPPGPPPGDDDPLVAPPMSHADMAAQYEIQQAMEAALKKCDPDSTSGGER